MSESTPPPPPPPPPPAGPPPGAASYDATAAIKYGWASFTKNPAPLLVPVIVMFLIIFAVQIVTQLVFAGIFLGDPECKVTIDDAGITSRCDGPGFFTGLFVAALVAAIGTFVAQILLAGLIRSALNIVDGQPALSIGEVFEWASKPGVVTTAAFLAGLSFVATLFFYLPALIIAVLTSFTLYFVVDRGLTGIAAITASVQFVISKLANTIVFMLLGFVVLLVGALACGVGIFAALPVVMIAGAYTFRVLHDQPVTPAP